MVLNYGQTNSAAVAKMIKYLKSYGFLLLFVWAAFLLFKGLGNAPLWDDEASTAWYARNILHAGVPTAWDGKNIFAPIDGIELNDDLVVASIPWLHYYIAAGSVALFGDSAWATRFPFALIGLLSVIFFFFSLKKMFSEQKFIWFGTILYIHSLPFLIYSRNCRYFSLLILFSTVWFWIMTHLEDRRRIVGLAILFTLFLHTHYLIAACFVGALFFTALLTAAHNKLWKEHFYSLIIASCFFLPWFYFYNPWHTAFKQLIAHKTFMPSVQTLFLYFYEINYNLIFPLLLLCLLPFAWMGSNPIRKKQIAAGTILLLSFVFCILVLNVTKGSHVRYTVSLIPLTAFLWTICLERIFEKTVLQISMIGLIIFTDIPSLPMLTKRTFWLTDRIFYQPKAIAFQHLPFLGYWNQMMHDFPRSYDVAVEMIRKHVPKDACVITYPDYHRRPLMYLLTQEYEFCEQFLPKPKSRWSEHVNPKFPESFFAPPQTIESWLVVFGDEGSERMPHHNELPPNTEGLQKIDEANWDCTAGSRPEFSVFQTQELPVEPGDPRAIRLYHYIPPRSLN